MTQGELDGALECGFDVLVGERHGARRIGDEFEVAARGAGERFADGGHVAERRAHEQELRVRQGEQRNLPGPAAVGVGEEVEFVHGHAAHIGVLAFAQRLVGEDLGGAADDGRARVDMRIAGDHAHIVATENVDQVEELLGYQGLDGGGVVCALTACHGHEHHAERDEGFARSRGRSENDVAARGEGEQRVFLVRPRFDAPGGDPIDEALVRLLGGEPGFGFGDALALCGVIDPPAGGEVSERSVGEGVEGYIYISHGGSVSSLLMLPIMTETLAESRAPDPALQGGHEVAGETG